MKIRKQSDQVIPIHIVSNISPSQATIEERIAKQHGQINKQLTHRRYGAASFDLGLTIEPSKNNSTSKSNKIFLTSLQQQYEKGKHRQETQLQPSYKSNMEFEPNNQQPDHRQQRAEAEAYVISRKGKMASTKTILENDMEQYDDCNDDQGEKENVDLSGRDMFGFSKAYKKSTISMMKRILKQDTTSIVENNSSNNNVKPKERGRPRKQAVAESTTGNKDKRRRLQRTTDLRKTVQQSGMDDNTHDGNNSDSKDDSDEYDDDNDNDDNEQPQRKEQSLLQETEGYERYFKDLHGSSKTSNNTMSMLPTLEPQEFQTILEAAPTKHAQERAKLSAHHEQHFPQWLFELQSGFNLLFYGYGSKRQLINKFAMQAMKDGPLVIVNGFFPTITIKDIMTKILVGALEAPSLPGTLQEQLAMVHGYFDDEARGYKKLCLVVHNIDGMNLRNENVQSALASLAESNKIHMIGSIDQINAGLLWDNVKSRRFNWLYHDATTYDNYLVETSFENTLLMGSTENGGARGVKHVLTSLTSNGRGIFKVLAEHQLLEMEINNLDRGTDQAGMPYHQYYEKCREQFLVSTETGMRSQLTEFKDHKVIVTKRLADGTELLFMPLDKATLMGIVENMD